MKWGEFVDRDEDCEVCPIKIAEICKGGMTCYGGTPIEPPCTSFDDDVDLDEWVKEYFEREKRWEEAESRKLREQEARKEKAKRAAETRRQMEAYCREELETIKALKKQLRNLEENHGLAQSLAFAINTTNLMFGYSERVEARLEPGIEALKVQIAEAEEKYQAKRKEFYQK